MGKRKEEKERRRQVGREREKVTREYAPRQQIHVEDIEKKEEITELPAHHFQYIDLTGLGGNR